MATTDVIFSRDDLTPSGVVKNGSIVIHAGITCGLFDVKDASINTGLSDDAIEAKYTDRFDDYNYYLSPRS
jgi:hypothetical protein